jgi:hypothetical protein
VHGTVEPYHALSVERRGPYVLFVVRTPRHVAQLPWLDEAVLWEPGELLVSLAISERCDRRQPLPQNAFATPSRALRIHPVVHGSQSRRRVDLHPDGPVAWPVCLGRSLEEARGLRANSDPAAAAAAELLLARNTLLWGYGSADQQVHQPYRSRRQVRHLGLHVMPFSEAEQLARELDLEVVPWREPAASRGSARFFGEQYDH